ncbi:AbrB/MazE/SpoVT family DNA-binding domain-containing protein [Sphingomonas bacterium]|uniref:AbrB/MazE/SpoVT family DNA-binding domain-containing protein n=1 Tax=Sphingomonas bacterium TaxID=1895847 RepID=UPI0015764AE0|nr:AbrB/MazE/SpoVT family DNA-binding domain-containing protein [Sphingomonas bacterium]
MGEEYRAKVFKSGNSLALRLPKALGLEDGDEVELISDGKGGFEIRPPLDEAATLDRLYGSFSPDFMDGGRLPMDDVDRDWSTASDRSAA